MENTNMNMIKREAGEFLSFMGIVATKIFYGLAFLCILFYIGDRFAPAEIALRNGAAIASNMSLWTRYLGFSLLAKGAAWKWMLCAWAINLIVLLLFQKCSNNLLKNVFQRLKKICVNISQKLLVLWVNACIVSLIFGIHIP